MIKNGKRLIFPALVNPRPEVEVIHCVDPRFQEAFGRFVREELELPDSKVIRVAIAGGPAPLAHPDDMRSRCRYIIRQTMFSCTNFPVKRVVLIGHECCGYYQVIPQNGYKGCCRENDDLPVAAKMLDLVVPEKVTVEAYYASFTDKKHTKISFKKI